MYVTSSALGEDWGQGSIDNALRVIPSLEEKCTYELSAVLIHRGVSAYSGHYIAHVRDARTNDWYKFNDEEIEKMEGKKLQLGIEEDLGNRWSNECHKRSRCVIRLHSLKWFFCLSAETGKAQTRKPKYSKGSHCSRNAYMLVYKRQEEQMDQTQTSVEVPGTVTHIKTI